MKKKSFLWAALSMTAALVMTACSKDDNANESPVQQNAAKTIPYTVTVNGGASTRATVESDNKTLYFAAGDKLYVTGTNIKGVLDIQTGTGTASATFSGDLTYSGEGSPAADLDLTATLVSAQQTDGSEVTINSTTGAVTVNYPTTSYCADVATAVQKYSNLTGTSTYGSKSFSLTQQTAFLNFVITFEDGTTTGTELSAVVSNNSAAICTANVTTVTDNGVKAKFVLPVVKGTTLSSANVKMGSKAAISFGASQTLDGKVYNVTRTQAAPAPTYTMAANATTDDIGKVVCAAGHLHDAKTAVPGGCTAVGILGKVTETGHGLILALKDAATQQKLRIINDWTSVDTYAGTTLKLLPASARGSSLTSYTMLGSTAVSDWCVAQKSDYEAIFINLGSAKHDEDGYTYDANVNAYITTGVGGTAISNAYWSATKIDDSYGWIFASNSWLWGTKGTDRYLRPVLGF